MKFDKFVGAIAILVATLLGSGCQKEPVVFEPACIAFSGDRITITGDRYVWERFTDIRRVDSDGNEIEPFPDYPKNGSIERDGNQLRFADAAGDAALVFHILEKDGVRYLLRDEEHKAVSAGAAIAKCALRQREESPESES